MSVVLIHEALRWEEKHILQQARGNDLRLDSVALKDTTWPAQSQFPSGTLFLIRCPGYFNACHVSSLLKYMGYRTVNCYEHIYQFGHKHLTDQILKSGGFPVIPSLVVFSVEQLNNVEKYIDYPMVSKPCIGGFGRFVHKIESRNQLIHVWDYISSFAPSYHKVLYLQPFISVAQDIRVIMIGGKVACAMERINSQCFKKNIALGGRGSSYALDSSEQEMISRLGRSLRWGFFGVDLLKDQNGSIYICEINAVCTFKEATYVTGIDIATLLINYLSKLTQEQDTCENTKLLESWELLA